MPSRNSAGARRARGQGVGSPRRTASSPNAILGSSGRSTKNYSTVSSGGGPRRVITYDGTPTTSQPTKLGKAKSEARAVRSALKRVRKAYKSGTSADANRDGTYSPDDAASLIRAVGGTKREARDLSTKVTGESGGNPKAVGDDAAAGYGNTYGLGLWQMTTGVGNDDLIAKHGGRKAMLKPKPNARAALELYRSGGIDNWYAPSTAPGRPRKPEPKVKPKPKDKATLRKAGIEPKEVKEQVKSRAAPPKPKKRPGPWAGSQKAVLSKVPPSVRPEGRGDKRTPAENSAVGGATNSDHLTTNQKSYAADLPPDDATARHIANRLGMDSHTGTNQVVKDGYEYTLIWQDDGHYDHIHIGAEWVGPGVPEGTTLGGPSGGGSSGGSTSGGSSAGSGTSGGSGTSAKGGKGMTPAQLAKKRLARVRGAFSEEGESTPPNEWEAIRRRYGSPVV